MLVAATAALALVSPGARAAPAGRADFSGTWKLNESLSTDPLRSIRDDRPTAALGGEDDERQSRSRRGAAVDAGALDLPYEALEDARWLVIADDGRTLRVKRSRGRQRIVHADGDERELDEGDGPAKVTAKRKGRNGERVVVASRWSSGREIQETWELRDAPRRLSITTKFRGRRSFTFERVYEPTTEKPPEPTPTTSPTPLPAGTPSPASPVGPPAVPPAPPAGTPPPTALPARPDCSVRPPRGASQQELAKLAKVSQGDASAKAVALRAPLVPHSVISSDVEVSKGCLVWVLDLRYADKDGVFEVTVDAGDGKVLASEFVKND